MYFISFYFYFANGETEAQAIRSSAEGAVSDLSLSSFSPILKRGARELGGAGGCLA